jgi:hypothetical protein
MFENTRARFLQEHKDVFLQTTLRNLISKTLSNLIDNKNMQEWKEILAYCVTYSEDGGKKLANELGDALLQKNQVDSAIICYIVANNFEATLELWDKKLRKELSQADYKIRSIIMHKTLEKVYALKDISHYSSHNSTMDRLIM